MGFEDEEYIFKSERLGFRPWKSSDLDNLVRLNGDVEVMKYFPKIPTRVDSQSFIERMMKMYEEKRYCYFVVEELKNSEFIGFIGISDVDFISDFTPCVDIGWRLLPEFWNQGYATEGARRCLSFVMLDLNISKIYAIAPCINLPSIRIMEKIKMQKVKTFTHPLLSEFETLKDCVLYRR